MGSHCEGGCGKILADVNVVWYCSECHDRIAQDRWEAGYDHGNSIGWQNGWESGREID